MLRDYADPESLSLNTKQQAQSVIFAIKRQARNWIDLDFSGITGVSWEFALDFLRIAQIEFPEKWLVPRHCGQGSEKLIGDLVSRLKRQRERAWLNEVTTP
jgi:hypothetical protein